MFDQYTGIEKTDMFSHLNQYSNYTFHDVQLIDNLFHKRVLMITVNTEYRM